MERYPFIFSDERKYRIRRHLTFWTAWWLFQGFLYSNLPFSDGQPYSARLFTSMLDSLVFLSVHMFLSYSLMYFVIPRYVLKEKYIVAITWVAALFVVTAALSSFCALVVIPPLHELFGLPASKRAEIPTTISIHMSLMAGLRGGLTIGGLAASIKLIKSLYMKEQRNTQLQKENIASQLQLLKAQVHPHFLFNTLNNIYSYTQNTSPEASRLVTGLSDLLRFILYECNQPLVPLAKELKMIHDYIELEKVRYGNELDLHVDLPQQTNDLYISPLLLLPLVENCFKHGTSQILDQPWISLHITIFKERHIQMKLLNGKSNEQAAAKTSSGIGIQNVQKRLELLYPDKHELIITNEEDVFIVNLKMELESINEPALRTNPLSLTHA
jgi:LytS/YehU family sensor histidine kinase